MNTKQPSLSFISFLVRPSGSPGRSYKKYNVNGEQKDGEAEHEELVTEAEQPDCKHNVVNMSV